MPRNKATNGASGSMKGAFSEAAESIRRGLALGESTPGPFDPQGGNGYTALTFMPLPQDVSMSDRENKEDLRAVPADQRSQGPNETMMISSTELANKVTAGAAGQARKIKGTPKLVGRSEAVAGQVYELTKPKTMIGRQDSNDIIIIDGTVSARHAQIVNDEGVWRVVNLISTNGTSVNGRNNVVSYLAPGDVISFGRVEMVFEAPESERTIPAAGALRQGRGNARSDTTKAVLWACAGAGLLIVLGVGARLLGLI